jgi:hypothetical protein
MVASVISSLFRFHTDHMDYGVLNVSYGVIQHGGNLPYGVFRLWRDFPSLHRNYGKAALHIIMQ